MKSEKIERVLIPYTGEQIPEKAEEKALERIEKGGKLFLLHIVDKTRSRSLRYRTGQIGNNSEIIKTFQNTLTKVQEKKAKKYVKEARERAAKKGVSIEALFSSGSPGKETFKAAKENSIQLIIVEKIRDKITEIFAGDEIGYIKKNAPCEVETIK